MQMQEPKLERLDQLRHEYYEELLAIVGWWRNNAIDHEQDGFYGEVNNLNQPNREANKGIILNARILWFFSESAIALEEKSHAHYLECVQSAQRAFDYIQQHFVDGEFGGVYWELSSQGAPVNTKKQVYAQAFAIYAFSAFYQLTRDDRALNLAVSCFQLIETHARDPKFGGYLEAFSRDWKSLGDVRLSDVDLNFPKSQNTHLHVLEAYTELYRIYATPDMKSALRYSIEQFEKNIINKQTHHLRMFMELDWQDRSPGYTFGHDIEASWLLARALDVLNEESYRQQLMPILLDIAQTTLHQGVGPFGQVIDGFNYQTNSRQDNSVWWVQAEALVGFWWAYTELKDTNILDAAESVWSFIKNYQIDKEKGEWLWFSRLDNANNGEQYKLGFWKCPYHNGRAMIEAIRFVEAAKGF